MWLMLVAIIYLLASRWRKKWILTKRFLRLVAFSMPLGFLAVEAGWTVTEVGRQPWIMYGIMRTKDALTPMPGIQYSFYTIVVIYLVLSLLVIGLMNRQIKALAQNYSSFKEPIIAADNLDAEQK